MKISIVILTFFISNLSFSQNSKTSLTFEQVGWTLVLPQNFKFIDSAESTRQTARGLKNIEDANGLQLDISSRKKLFSGTINGSFLDAALTPFDPNKEDYKATSAYSREMLFKTFESKMTGTTVDSLLTTFSIDGLEFYKFNIAVSMNHQVIMTMVLLGSHYQGYNIDISYLYRTKNAKEEIELYLKDSKFKKS